MTRTAESDREHETVSTLSADVLGIGALWPSSTPVWIDVPGADGARVQALRLEGVPGQGIIPPMKLRRMGRTQAMAVAAMHQAVAVCAAPLASEDETAVCVGTALGELGETVDFLENMIRLEEREPKPACFINSVHNALAAQIALLRGWRGENHTFVHRALSFETALWQALQVLRAGRAPRAVVCGVDGLNTYVLPYGLAYGWYDDPAPGRLPGEGAAAFVLGPPESDQPRIARIDGLIVRPAPTRLERDEHARHVARIEALCAQRPTATRPGALLLLGAADAGRLEPGYSEVAEALRSSGIVDVIATYRHLSGEFCTAAALGMALAVRTVVEGRLPPGVAPASASGTAVGAVLLYHRQPDGAFSLVRVSA